MGYKATMPRKPNSSPSVKITIRTSAIVSGDLDKIVATGYFGTTRAEAAERLLTEAIRKLLKEESVFRREPVNL